MAAKITVRVDKRARVANAYADGIQFAIMDQHMVTNNWLYNDSPADAYKPRMFSTGMKSANAAARRAYQMIQNGHTNVPRPAPAAGTAHATSE